MVHQHFKLVEVFSVLWRTLSSALSQAKWDF